MEEEKRTKDVRLLREEIEYWDRIYRGKEQDRGETNSSLCGEYFLPGVHHQSTDSTHCAGCPIYEKTRQKFCRATPYFWWQVHHMTAEEHDDNRLVRCPRCAELAMAMKRWLEMFLEEEFSMGT